MIRANLITLTFVCALALSTAAQSLTDTKLDPKDKDCPAGETVTESRANEVKWPVEAPRLVAARYVPGPHRFAVKPEGAEPFYRTNRPPANRETGQQQAQAEDAQALAKKLSNPVASLISLPIQSNFDFGMGPTGDGFRYTLNIQPVIPISLNKDWNLISRTIIPVIGQTDVVAPSSSQFGLGDMIQTFFFSPNKSEPFVWGIGPQVLIPTATNKFLGAQKLGLGPTGLVLKQQGQWTVGALIGHIWSVAGKSTRSAVSSTNIQPFVSYSTKTAWTIALNTESTYDWRSKTWNVPVHLTVSKLVRFGRQPASFGVALRCWAASSPGGPESCGFRFIVTPLFPKK
jgi:hypothetical protein